MKAQKLLSMLLALLMLFSTLAVMSVPATAEEKPADSTEKAAVNNAKAAVSKPQINERFDGEVIRFFVNRGSDNSVHARSIVLGEDDDPDYEVNAKVKERNYKVENELGVTIELAATQGMQEAFGFLQPILASRLYTYDVLALYQYYDLGLALGDTVGSFYNYLNMPEGSYIDLDAPYWNRNLFNALTYKNTAFFLTGDITQTTVSTMFVSYVNATMWDQYKDDIARLQNNPEGYTSIYDIVKNGYWTMDLWCELCAMPYEDLNSNDRIDRDDKVGLMLYEENINCMMIDMFAAGAGITYSTRNDNGEPVIAINTPYNVAFYQKLYKLTCESKAARVPPLYDDDGEWYPLIKVFSEGRVLMMLDTLGAVEESLTGMTDDYYIMPLPMYDRGQFKPGTPSLGYKTQLGDSVSQFAICTAAGDDRIPAITATLELMGYYSMTLVTPAYYDKALKGRYTRHAEDADIIDMIHEGIYADFAVAWASRLDYLTWYYRCHYTEVNKIARNLKSEQDKKTLKMQKLLVEIEEAFYTDAPYPPAVLCGDVNGDGEVNKKDSLRLKQYLADDSTPCDLAAADVNADGAVNKKDSLRLKQFLAGWDVQLGGDEEPEFDTPAWAAWLAEVEANAAEQKYPMFLSGTVYANMMHYNAAGEEDSTVGSPWEFWPGPGNEDRRFHLCYTYEAAEVDLSANVGTEDYEWIWEIWYRPADEGGEFKKIETKPWSIYMSWGDRRIYRIPTYNEGMNDMTLPEGEASRDYEFIFVIYKDEVAPDNIVGWNLDWLTYSDSTEKFIEDAKAIGYISDEPRFDTSDWVEWLIDEDANADEPKYNRFISGQSYGNITHQGAEDPSPWEFWPGPGYEDRRLHLCYMYDKNEVDLSANYGTEDYEYIWEIWYRDSEAGGEFKKIVTAPWSIYMNFDDYRIYRIPTYNEGMNDMYLPEGETSHEYEFVFVIYRDDIAPGNVVGWNQDWINYTDSTEMYIEDAMDYGYIPS